MARDTARRISCLVWNTPDYPYFNESDIKGHGKLSNPLFAQKVCGQKHHLEVDKCIPNINHFILNEIYFTTFGTGQPVPRKGRPPQVYMYDIFIFSNICQNRNGTGHYVIKWKHFLRNWPFVRGIHRSPVNSPHKGQWHGALMFPLICIWINSWENNREAGDLRCCCAHYDVTVMRILPHRREGIAAFFG